MNIIRFFTEYQPPKQLRALFIAHYAPLLLILLLGPLTALKNIWHIPLPFLPVIISGLIVFFAGAFLYFKWERYWHTNYKGQLLTQAIFKHIRHPHYTSLLIIGYGLALFFYSLACLLIATIAIPIMICSIIDEEKILLQQYGQSYQRYMKQVPWRMIPKLF